MTTPTPNTSHQSVPEVLEQTNSPAYVPYPLEGIQDEHSTLKPTVGLPQPNKVGPLHAAKPITFKPSVGTSALAPWSFRGSM